MSDTTCWTRERPTEPGYYWLRLPYLAPQIVCVAMDRRTVEFVGSDDVQDLDPSPPTGMSPDIDPAAQWLGPIPLPP